MPEDKNSSQETLAFVVSIDEDDVIDTAEKAIFSRSATGTPVLRQIPVTTLQESLNQTLSGLDQVFKIKPSPERGLSLKTVQVSFEVTASGKIALIGTSVELGGKGAITLTFER